MANETANTPGSTPVRVLGSIPRIRKGGVPTSGGETREVFDFEPHSVLAQPDTGVTEAAANIPATRAEESAPNEIRIDRAQAAMHRNSAGNAHSTEPSAKPTASSADATRVDSFLDEYISPAAVPGRVTAHASEPTHGTSHTLERPVEQPLKVDAPRWSDIALAAHAAIAPHIWWIALIALLATAGLLVLVLQWQIDNPPITGPNDFVPVAEADQPIKPLNESVNTARPLPAATKSDLARETPQPLQVNRQPAEEPNAETVRRASDAPPQRVETAMASPLVDTTPPVPQPTASPYPTTGIEANAPVPMPRFR